MNELDQHLARHMQTKPLYWQRYVDDIVCLDICPKKLVIIANEIESFLGSALKLSLHPAKTIIQPLARGLDHLGYFHLPNRTYPRKRVLKSVCNVINNAVLGPDLAADAHDILIPRINSYLGHFRHADSYNIRREICKTISQHDKFRHYSICGDFTSIRDLRIKRKRQKILTKTISEIFADSDVYTGSYENHPISSLY
jgi:RNA-directed DNA polymerase